MRKVVVGLRMSLDGITEDGSPRASSSFDQQMPQWATIAFVVLTLLGAGAFSPAAAQSTPGAIGRRHGPSIKNSDTKRIGARSAILPAVSMSGIQSGYRSAGPMSQLLLALMLSEKDAQAAAFF
jgi:hypothetical protein